MGENIEDGHVYCFVALSIDHWINTSTGITIYTMQQSNLYISA